MTLRVVFDTNVVLSALLFQAGRLAWLRNHWASGAVRVVGSKATVDEIIAALAYPKFRLAPSDIAALLSDVLPHVEVVANVGAAHPVCRDPADRKFIDLAISARADVLVTGDKDLLALKDQVAFAIETPAEYARRFVD